MLIVAATTALAEEVSTRPTTAFREALKLRGVAGEIVPPAAEGVVAHGIQADVHQAGMQPMVQIGRDATVLVPMGSQLAADVDGLPLRVPRAQMP
jgi:hypothetical protein